MSYIQNLFSYKNDEIPKDYFRRHKIVLKWSGIPLEDNNSIIFKLYNLVVYAILSGHIFLEFSNIFTNSYEDAVDMLMYHLGFGTAWIKMILFNINRKKIVDILRKIEEKPFTVDYSRGGDIEKKYIQKFCTINLVQTIIYWIALIVIHSINILYAARRRMIDHNPESWHLPYGKIATLNLTYTPAYEISLFYQAVSGTLFFMNYTSSDLITTGILCNLSYQFKILQHSLKNIVGHATRNVASYQTVEFCSKNTISFSYLKQRLKEVVDYHLAIINLTQDMEKVLNKLMLIVFLNNLIIVGSSFYRIFLSIEDSRIYKRFMEVGTVFFQLFILTFWGDRIVTESQAVGLAAYQANFIGTDLRFQKGLQLVILRSQTSVRLTTGKFSDLCLATLMWVVRTAYSAFMVFRRGH